MKINIAPVSAFPAQATQLDVSDGHVTLGQGAHFQAILLDANSLAVSVPFRVGLTEEQYNGWIGDDVYVANAVAVNLGLTPA